MYFVLCVHLFEGVNLYLYTSFINMYDRQVYAIWSAGIDADLSMILQVSDRMDR